MEKININYIYHGECLGCKHLFRLNKFSSIWACDLQYKYNDNGASWREQGKKMKKCKHFEQYTEKRCIDCALACSSSNDPSYWHCKTDHHCFNYTAKACKFFNGSKEDYENHLKQQEIEAKRKALLAEKETYLKAIEKIDEELSK